MTLITPQHLRRTLFACTFLFSASSFAITNIESERLNNTEEGTTGTMSLSMDGKVGSSDKIALGSALKLIRAYRRDELIAILSRDYAEIDDEVNTDESFVHLRYLTKNTPNWGHEVFVQHEEDQFNVITRRTLIGAGMRYTLTPKPDQHQANHIGFGLFHEEEFYQDSSAQPNDKNTRLNLYWAYKNQLSDNSIYTSTFYFQPNIEELGDEKGLWQNALTISVTSTISLSLTWDVKHDTQAPDGEDNTETTYKNVLIYNF
jgi:hypothetical protein